MSDEHPNEPGPGSSDDMLKTPARRSSRPLRIVIVGGGITGLAAAYDLQEALKNRGIAQAHLLKGDSERARSRAQAPVEIVLLEQDARLGGKVWTERIGDFLIEAGPDSFVTNKKSVLELADRLGLTDQLLAPDPRHAGSHVWWRGRLHPLPEGLVLMVPSRLGPLFNSSLLSAKGKLRLLLDWVIPPRRWGEEDDESLEQFVTRRLGREVLDRIAEPLVAGIHSAEPSSMSLRASFPRFIEMEKSYGSLIRAALAARARGRSQMRRETVNTNRNENGSPRYSHFMSFREGMGTLVSTLRVRLDGVQIRTECRVESLRPRMGQQQDETGRASTGYDLSLVAKSGSGSFSKRGVTEIMRADAVILALPSQASATLLEGVAPEASEALREIRAVSTATMHVAYRKKDVPVDLPGSGFVVPAKEKRRIRGVTFVSQKWFGRAPEDFILLRVFVGGVEGRELAEAPEEEMAEAVQKELKSMLGITAEPVMTRCHAWPNGMHSYTLGHVQRVARAMNGIDTLPGIFLAGGAYEGIGLNDCIRTGQAAAKASLAYLKDLH